MVTTQQAEGFSPPTTKGTKPTVVGCSGVVLFALLGIVGRHDGGRRCAFPSSLWFTRVLMCWMGCNGKTQTLFAVRPVIETISNL